LNTKVIAKIMLGFRKEIKEKKVCLDQLEEQPPKSPPKIQSDQVAA
jgi:hypothetical protein